ncbi:efflux RND transporter periplasmic adaptor subunit [Xanthomonas sp. XNM01]|uniref:efflux RND transporter periplasmic adaptor subunit n=1 Tax=Xanthomonas sp. XNM01 TaxID=2769289 RepID=UPI00177BD134|nr:efflux RND transporter periplasmic adaptor subunit [Xanthomonas sp. XNM01]MBD9368230.1 efflux RND transporter periplasmic adaptor subunit [Xanthomonas sp. XNM01]
MSRLPIRAAVPAALLCLLLSGCGDDKADAAHDHDHAPKAASSEGRSGDRHDHAEDEDHAEDGHATSTTIDAAIAADAGIRVATAGAGVLTDAHEVQGLLLPVEGRSAQVAARFAGPIRSVRVQAGDTVRAGQVLATVESNLSLSSYAITAPLAGVVMSRQAEVGGMAAEGAVLFEIADLSTLWVDLHLFGADAEHIAAGAPATVSRLSDGVSIDTVLDRVLPGMATASQSTVARARIDNSDGRWRPGSAVKARVTVEKRDAALVLPQDAVQQMDGQDVVFINTGERYDARPVKLGYRDDRQVEILDGLKAGEQVVVAQSYVVKADIEKAGATHAH